MSTPRITIVRHAETAWSLSGQHTSHTDLAITPEGRENVAGLRRVLAVDEFARVFTSPLRRARETCEVAGFGEVAEDRAELAEWDYGEYEGRTTADIRVDEPGWSLWADGAPGGETPGQVAVRVDRFVAELRACDGEVLVFSHGHLSRVLAARWIGLPVATGQSFVLGTGSISVLGDDRGTPVIERWNDAGHLDGQP